MHKIADFSYISSPQAMSRIISANKHWIRSITLSLMRFKSASPESQACGDLPCWCNMEAFMLIQLHLPSTKVMTGFSILLKLQQISYGTVMVQDRKYSCFGTRITAIKWTGPPTLASCPFLKILMFFLTRSFQILSVWSRSSSIEVSG